jgi:hypothetical protein
VKDVVAGRIPTPNASGVSGSQPVDLTPSLSKFRTPILPNKINSSDCLVLLLIFLMTALAQSLERLTHGGQTDVSLWMIVLGATLSQCPLWWAISYSRASTDVDLLSIQLSAHSGYGP